jgi:hypothetical protein
VFAVVEDEQEVPRGKGRGKPAEKVTVFGRHDAETDGGGDRVGHAVGLADRSQFHEIDAVVGLVEQLGGDAERQPGFTGPAGACQGDETVIPNQSRQRRDLLVPPDEARALHWEVVARDVKRLQRRERRRDSWGLDLQDRDRLEQIAKADGSEFPQVGVGR